MCSVERVRPKKSLGVAATGSGFLGDTNWGLTPDDAGVPGVALLAGVRGDAPGLCGQCVCVVTGVCRYSAARSCVHSTVNFRLENHANDTHSLSSATVARRTRENSHPQHLRSHFTQTPRYRHFHCHTPALQHSAHGESCTYRGFVAAAAAFAAAAAASLALLARFSALFILPM